MNPVYFTNPQASETPSTQPTTIIGEYDAASANIHAHPDWGPQVRRGPAPAHQQDGT